MKQVIAVLVALQFVTLGVLVVDHRNTQRQLDEMGDNLGSCYDRLYTLETGKPVPSQEEGE